MAELHTSKAKPGPILDSREPKGFQAEGGWYRSSTFGHVGIGQLVFVTRFSTVTILQSFLGPTVICGHLLGCAEVWCHIRFGSRLRDFLEAKRKSWHPACEPLVAGGDAAKKDQAKGLNALSRWTLKKSQSQHCFDSNYCSNYTLFSSRAAYYGTCICQETDVVHAWISMSISDLDPAILEDILCVWLQLPF